MRKGMRRIVHIILLIQTLALPISVKAQYYSVNFDTKTVAAMSAAFNTEAATEMYYAEQLAKIRKSYLAHCSYTSEKVLLHNLQPR